MNNMDYVPIFGWMINSLNLKGTELCVYAYIRSCTEEDVACYTGTPEDIYDCIKDIDVTATEDRVKAAVESLLNKHLIKRIDYPFGTADGTALEATRL